MLYLINNYNFISKYNEKIINSSYLFDYVYLECLIDYQSSFLNITIWVLI